jgi:NADH dehydrogenase FAD-containing subunit
MIGQVATLGRYKGIADVSGVRFRGFPGWFVARSYHLYALPMMRRKLRVVADWTVSLSSSAAMSPSPRRWGTLRRSIPDRSPVGRLF